MQYLSFHIYCVYASFKSLEQLFLKLSFNFVLLLKKLVDTKQFIYVKKNMGEV